MLLPRIRYNPPAPGSRNAFRDTLAFVEYLFKFVGWMVIIGALNYGYIKTQSFWFLAPAGILTANLGYLLYTFFMRFEVTLSSGRTIKFDDGRPAPFSWVSLIAMILVTGLAWYMIQEWAQAFVEAQAK